MISGFINLDKDSGPSSQAAVTAIRRLLKVKAGHCGTLDPLASGVLPICLGRATRLSQYVMGRRKRYVARLRLGLETDSYDIQGRKLAQSDASAISAGMIEALLPRYIGDIMQKPPAVSALKQGGEALYKKQRRGEEVDIVARPVSIYSLRLLGFKPGEQAEAELEIECGQGAYIRSLAHDIGAELGVGACLSALRRTVVGDLHIKDSHTVAEINAMAEQGDHSFIIPMEQALSHIPGFTVPAGNEWRAAHGNDILLPEQASGSAAAAPALRIMDGKGTLIGIGHMEAIADNFTLKMDKTLVEAERYDGQRPLSVCAIGNFDGLHLGHRALFEQVAELRRDLGGLSAMVTFSPHPLALIKGQPPLLLMAEPLKRDMLRESFAVDRVETLDFDRKLMNSSPQAFVDEVIVRRLQARQVVVGYNFTFAAHGAGTAETLRQLCGERGVAVSIVDEVTGPYGTVSSSNIRRRLKDGDMQAVNAMLGYWFTLTGPVVYGNQLGRSFGFPTANVAVDEGQAMPPRGVYAARVEHGGSCYDAVANFGVKPTIGGEVKPLMEAHLFDVDIDLYGDDIRIYLGSFLRPERRFAGSAELIAQITSDSREAREFLAARDKNAHRPRPIAAK